MKFGPDTHQRSSSSMQTRLKISRASALGFCRQRDLEGDRVDTNDASRDGFSLERSSIPVLKLKRELIMAGLVEGHAKGSDLTSKNAPFLQTYRPENRTKESFRRAF